MISGILTPGAAFLTGTALAWLLNYRKLADQQKIIRLHGANVVFVVSALYGAGVLMGVLTESGMAAAMATAASIAFPPAFITSSPIWAPWGMEVQAMAFRAYTTFRREG